MQTSYITVWCGKLPEHMLLQLENFQFLYHQMHHPLASQIHIHYNTNMIIISYA